MEPNMEKEGEQNQNLQNRGGSAQRETLMDTKDFSKLPRTIVLMYIGVISSIEGKPILVMARVLGSHVARAHLCD